MHILGKVLAWFVVVGCLVAITFTSQTLGVRSYWMKKLRTVEQEFERNQSQLVEKRAHLHQIEGELTRSLEPWDRYWSNVGATPSDKGGLVVQVGTNKGLQDKQVVYVFATPADGSVRFLGDYRVTAARDDQSALEPNWRVRPIDPQLQDQTVRVRTQVPPSYLDQLVNLERQLLATDEKLLYNEREVERQAVLLKSAQEHLAFRLQQINGQPDMKGKDVPREIVVGLLTALLEEEDRRNATLVKVDHLLRQLKTTRSRLKTVLADNRAALQSLPQVPAPAASVSQR